MMLIILTTLVATCLAAPAAQSLTFHDDGSYRFYYETGREGGSHSRTEVRNPDGVVIGKFSYEDPDGEMREVNYRADESGFVANGDVGVKGAPKGQFPVNQDEQPQEQLQEQPPSTTIMVEEVPAEPKKASEPAAEVKHVESFHDDEDKDEMQDLTLEESAPNDPPEAFPAGFFLQKFQGLRRLPEPTKEDKKPVTTESSKDEKTSQPEITKPNDDSKEQAVTSTTEVKSGGIGLSPRLNPFQALSPQEWASSMFHQPVYVFSYNHPDSYGYHYYF